MQTSTNVLIVALVPSCARAHTHARALATNTQSHVSVGREKAGNVTVVSPADCGNIPAIMKPLCTAMEQFIAASPLLAYDQRQNTGVFCGDVICNDRG